MNLNNINDSIESHIRSDNWEDKQQCEDCYAFLDSDETMESHINSREHRITVEKIIKTLGGKLLQTSLNRKMSLYEIENTTEYTVFIKLFFSKHFNLVRQIVHYQLMKHTTIKVQLQLMCVYGKGIEGTKGYETKNIGHHNKTTPIYPGTNLNNLLMELLNDLEHRALNHEEKQSGYYIKNILSLRVKTTKFAMLSAGSYNKNFKIDNVGVISPKNNDIYCFKWCLVIGMTYKVKNITHKERVSQYNVRISNSQIYLRENDFTLNFSNMEFPLSLKMIEKFERINPDISINVFGYDKKNNTATGPLYVTKEEKTHHFNLVMMEHNGEYHFAIIIKLARYDYFLFCCLLYIYIYIYNLKFYFQLFKKAIDKT